MLQANVSQMLKGSIGTTRLIEVDDDVPLGDKGTGHVVGEARLTRTNRSILVQAELNTTISTECARCLEIYPCPIHIRFDEEFFPVTDVNSGLPVPEPEEDDSFTIDEHLVLDLTESVRQYVMTNMPMKPLCRADCPGIRV